MRPRAIPFNTARGGLVDETAMVDALRSGDLRHAGLDVSTVESLPAGQVLTTLPNVTPVRPLRIPDGGVQPQPDR